MTACVPSLLCGLFGLTEAAVQWLFFRRLLGGRRGAAWGIPFLLLCLPLLHLPAAPVLFAFLLFLYGRWAEGISPRRSMACALTAAGAMRLCFGLCQCLLPLLAPGVFSLAPGAAGLLLMAAGEALSLGLTLGCFRILSRYFWAEALPSLWALAPLLLLLLAGEYAGGVLLGSTAVLRPVTPALTVRQLSLLAMLALGIASLFALELLCRRLADSQARCAGLTEQVRCQRQYVREARARYVRTGALRHDMTNHLLVLQGLAAQGRWPQAVGYLRELTGRAGDTAFPFSTNHPVLDVLLGNAAAEAAREGIALSCALRLPSPCPIRDADLCVLFSNALDNALRACKEAGEPRWIRISGRRQGAFLLLTVENSCRDSAAIRPGTGLSNIRHTAAQYGGTVDIGIEGGVCTVHILLNLSPQSNDIS